MYAAATGYLGWSPDVAWHTPLPELFLALDARVEWVRMTSPFGSKPEPKKSTPGNVADKLRQALTGRKPQ